MSLILELLNNVKLTDTQKGLIASIKISATPEQAYETAMGSTNASAALSALINIGYCSMSNGQVLLTPDGENALITNNLIDDSGELTDSGKQLSQAFTINKQEYVNMEGINLKWFNLL